MIYCNNEATKASNNYSTAAGILMFITAKKKFLAKVIYGIILN